MMSCWEILLSKGQEWDWYNDPFWKAQTLAVLFVVCLVALLFRELRIANPVVNFRPLGERNLAASSIIIFCAYGVLYGASVCLPSLLQSLFGYDAFVSGAGDVALRRLLHPDDARRRRPPRSGHRRPLADRRRACSSWRPGATGWRG